jgi:branched-chain amino acid transport system ATP-binding protein
VGPGRLGHRRAEVSDDRFARRRDARRSVPRRQGIDDAFGGICALADVSFDVAQGGITGLIGPNGAGKTTCFNCITRLYQPTSGSVALGGDDLLAIPRTRSRAERIARTFQNVALFAHMSVLDNVLVGFHSGCAKGRGARE